MKLLRKRPWRILTLVFLTVGVLVFCAQVVSAMLDINMPYSSIGAILLGVSWAYVLSQFDYWWNH